MPPRMRTSLMDHKDAGRGDKSNPTTSGKTKMNTTDCNGHVPARSSSDAAISQRRFAVCTNSETSRGSSPDRKASTWSEATAGLREPCSVNATSYLVMERVGLCRTYSTDQIDKVKPDQYFFWTMVVFQ